VCDIEGFSFPGKIMRSWVSQALEKSLQSTHKPRKSFSLQKKVFSYIDMEKGNDISRYSNFLSYRVELSPIQVTLSVDLKIKAVK
jgi:hypothetical protein